jgi:thiol-disulfide isomerase/thioredoxin
LVHCDSLDPSSPAWALWTDAALELAALVEDPARADGLVDRIIDQHPRAEVGGRLLLLRLDRAINRREDAKVAALEARLRSPRFARTSAALAASMLRENKANLRITAGDTLPPLALPLLSGGTLDIAPDRPLLVYFSASWCEACIYSLPDMRRLAREHSELQIAYVLWDDLDDANAFVQRHAPVPGAVVHADEPTRAAVLAAVVEHPVFPSFVLAGADGRVLATSKDHDLDELGALLSRAAP